MREREPQDEQRDRACDEAEPPGVGAEPGPEERRRPKGDRERARGVRPRGDLGSAAFA